MKGNHAELKDLQAGFSKRAKETNIFGDFKRPSGKPLTGVDITYLGCFRRPAKGLTNARA
jgi:hypothetical protein